MTTNLSLLEAKKEWVFFLRNQDILTIAQRGVTTTTDTGTFSADSDHLIAVSNVKNVRSIVVAGTTLSYGTDYTVDVNFSDTTIKCKITFIAAQTGAYTITYDYGTDKIWPDFPRNDLTISSFPRIGADIVTLDTVDVGMGGVLANNLTMTTIVYADKTTDIITYIDSIRAAVLANKDNFYYLGKYVKTLSTGPILLFPSDKGKDKILQQNVDIIGKFFYEKP